VKLLAGGAAREYFGQRNICFETLDQFAGVEGVLPAVRPGLLLCGTSEDPDTPGLAMIEQARGMGIVSVGVVDFIANAEYRFRGRGTDSLEHAPDWLLLPDRWTREAYTALGYPEERALVCGHPHYDYVRELAVQLSKENRGALRERLLPGIDKHSWLAVFVAEVSTGLNPGQYRCSEQYTLPGRGGSSGRTEIVLEEFLDAVSFIKPRPYLVLRLHPKNIIDEFTAYLQEFDAVSSGGNPLELIFAADLVVGMSSMLLLEAVLLGRQVLSILPRSVEKEWLPTLKYGVPYCATTRKELMGMLQNLVPGNIAAAPAGAELFELESGAKVLAAVARILEQAV
jgi:hypothetical protein